MGNRLPNLPKHTHLFLVFASGILLSGNGVAAPGKFIQEHTAGRILFCATLLPKHDYSFIPPVHGRLIRLGTNTVCYIADGYTAETLHFVETDATGLLTDAGTVTLHPTFQE